MDLRHVLPRDAIQSLGEPTFAPEHAGEPDDEVVVVDADPPRAYPIRILSHHEVVNDVLGPPACRADAPAAGGASESAGEASARAATGDEEAGDGGPTGGVDEGRPIAVTWCPICWSVAVYDAVVDGRALTFGVSGKLADDALVLYDRETGSEWRQTSGEAIAGPLAGARLETLPGPIVSAGEFAEDHPEGVVLQPPRGPADPATALAEHYEMGPYDDYRERAAFGLHAMRGAGPPRAWDREDLGAKTLVLGIEHDDEAVGYPAPRVADAGGVVRDTVGGLDVLVVRVPGGADAADRLFAYRDPGAECEVRDGSLHADGTTWDPASGESADGRRVEPLPARTLFAFAWQDVHGPEAFFEPG